MAAHSYRSDVSPDLGELAKFLILGNIRVQKCHYAVVEAV
jgi:hypothetical protein